MVVSINKEECKGCGYCVEACPKEGVLRMGSEVNARGYFYAVIENSEDCNECGLCRIMCPDFCFSKED